MALNYELIKVMDTKAGLFPATVKTVSGVMVNGATAFTVSNGPILIDEIISVCDTANNATASTLQWQSVPTVGSAATISGATASLASATAGTTIRLSPTALSTAPNIVAASAGGVQLGTNVANRITVQPGTLKLVIGVGSTTGNWTHYIRYYPLSSDAVVS